MAHISHSIMHAISNKKTSRRKVNASLGRKPQGPCLPNAQKQSDFVKAYIWVFFHAAYSINQSWISSKRKQKAKTKAKTKNETYHGVVRLHTCRASGNFTRLLSVCNEHAEPGAALLALAENLSVIPNTRISISS